MPELKASCPFCGGNARFCDEANNEHDEPHECHYIVCVGGCGATFDLGYGKQHETLAELREACANHWNSRTAVEV